MRHVARAMATFHTIYGVVVVLAGIREYVYMHAIHVHPSNGITTPVSHRCVRVSMADARCASPKMPLTDRTSRSSSASGAYSRLQHLSFGSCGPNYK